MEKVLSAVSSWRVAVNVLLIWMLSLQVLAENIRVKRKMLPVNDWDMIWPASEPIPYMIGETVPKYLVKAIHEGIAYWTNNTCMRFEEVTCLKGIDDYIGFTTFNWSKAIPAPVQAVTSHLGMRNMGENQIQLSMQSEYLHNLALASAIVSHELGHVMGMHHEMSRVDVDDSVCVNIGDRKSWEPAFATYKTNILGVPYDLGSTMHYGNNEQYKNQFQILTRDPLMETSIGRVWQGVKLSFYDVFMLNLAFCNKSCLGGLQTNSCKHGGFKNPQNCRTCICAEGFTGERCESMLSYGAEDDTHIIHIEPGKSGKLTQAFTSTTDKIRSSWLITTTPGAVIGIQVIFISFNVTEDSERVVEYISRHRICLDWLEVKYKDIAGAGPQFCSYPNPGGNVTVDFMPPLYPPLDYPWMWSNSKEVLLLYNQNENREGSFTIKYEARHEKDVIQPKKLKIAKLATDIVCSFVKLMK